MQRQGTVRLPVPGAPGSGPAAASTSLLVVRYPAAIDVPPVLTDDVTPASGILGNYLGLMLEAIMAEVGPIRSTSDLNPVSLLDFLGVETANRISNWRAQSKAAGGNEAGQVFGLIKKVVSKTAAGYDADATLSATSFQGRHPDTARDPIAFFSVNAASGHAAPWTNIINGPGGGVRGAVFWSGGGTALTVRYRGHPAKTSATMGPVVGSATVVTDVLILFLVEAF